MAKSFAKWCKWVYIQRWRNKEEMEGETESLGQEIYNEQMAESLEGNEERVDGSKQ